MAAKYRLVIEARAAKQLNKLDPFQQRFILSWLRKNVDGTDDPRAKGKGLSENLAGLWRYRIGDYRVICDIRDDMCEIIAVEVGHRSSIY
ncbi:MAG: type II toxin-antitoxin system RelE/ParE family toxin [Clostridiales Family XIII bacterium]|nr:type II toxin-antitoxin system RelE/ParE family toxin [Clostridiales Family XIII bacterium]